MTGFHAKPTSVGTNWTTGEEIVFPAKNYTFPACDSCNNKFGELEGQVKGIVERLEEDQEVKGGDLERLLDWFDKIRVGAWLGIAYLNKSTFTDPPNHYISDRVGIKDRYLSITNTYLPVKTLNWSGANTMTFMASPTALMLRVNNLVFVTASTDFLVSKSVGFPFAAWEYQVPGSNIAHFKLTAGTKRVTPDCFRQKPYIPSYVVRQPIYAAAQQADPALYANAYVINNSYDPTAGRGKIFLQRNQKTQTLEREEKVDFKMEAARSIYGRVAIVRPIIELQIEMLKSRMKRLRYVSAAEQARQLKGADVLISYAREQIRQFNY